MAVRLLLSPRPLLYLNRYLQGGTTRRSTPARAPSVPKGAVYVRDRVFRTSQLLSHSIHTARHSPFLRQETRRCRDTAAHRRSAHDSIRALSPFVPTLSWICSAKARSMGDWPSPHSHPPVSTPNAVFAPPFLLVDPRSTSRGRARGLRFSARVHRCPAPPTYLQDVSAGAIRRLSRLLLDLLSSKQHHMAPL